MTVGIRNYPRRVLSDKEKTIRATLARIPASTGSGAPTTASYVTLATDATLTSERVLTAGANITLTDNGAGNTLVVASTAGGAPATAQYLTLAADATLTVERVFTPGTNLTAVDSGAGAAYTVATGYLLMDLHVIPADFTITAGYSSVLSRYIEVGSGFTLTIGADADLEVL